MLCVEQRVTARRAAPSAVRLRAANKAKCGPAYTRHYLNHKIAKGLVATFTHHKTPCVVWNFVDLTQYPAYGAVPAAH